MIQRKNITRKELRKPIFIDAVENRREAKINWHKSRN